jgi:hypothetical protein
MSIKPHEIIDRARQYMEATQRWREGSLKDPAILGKAFHLLKEAVQDYEAHGEGVVASQLEFFTTADLMREILRRTGHGALICWEEHSDGHLLRRQWKGNTHFVIGLLEDIKRAMLDDYEENGTLTDPIFSDDDYHLDHQRVEEDEDEDEDEVEEDFEI